WVVEGQPFRREVVAVVDVDDRVGLNRGLGLVHDGIDGGDAGRSPSCEHTGPFERIAGERAEPDHSSTSKSRSASSLTVSTRATGQSGRPARFAASTNSAIATSTASSLLFASTTICAP